MNRQAHLLRIRSICSAAQRLKSSSPGLRDVTVATLPGVGLAAFFIPVVIPAKAVLKMEAELFVGNLPGSWTRDELRALFAQAGEVTAADVIKDRQSGESRGFGFITMSAQNEADKAVSMFNRYALGKHVLKVRLVRPRQQRGTTDPLRD